MEEAQPQEAPPPPPAGPPEPPAPPPAGPPAGGKRGGGSSRKGKGKGAASLGPPREPPTQMQQWFAPHVIGGAQEKRPGGPARNILVPDTKLPLVRTLNSMRDEVADIRTVKEVYPSAHEFAEISLARKAYRSQQPRMPPIPPRPERPALLDFLDRQIQTTGGEVGSFAEFDPQGERVRTMARMPRAPELRHKLKIGELGMPPRGHPHTTEELKRRAFKDAADARDSQKNAERRAAFEPVAEGVQGTTVEQLVNDPALADSIRRLKARVASIDKEREIGAILAAQPRTTQHVHGSFYDKPDAQELMRRLAESGRGTGRTYGGHAPWE